MIKQRKDNKNDFSSFEIFKIIKKILLIGIQCEILNIAITKINLNTFFFVDDQIKVNNSSIVLKFNDPKKPGVQRLLREP